MRLPVIIAAVLARGRTILENAAIEPEIVDLALFLQSMGAIITQETDRTWSIQGVDGTPAASQARTV